MLVIMSSIQQCMRLVTRRAAHRLRFFFIRLYSCSYDCIHLHMILMILMIRMIRQQSIRQPQPQP
jgi:hypothetical protein